MPRELEAKFRLERVDELRARLRQLAACPVAKVCEGNVILDTADAALRRAGCALRVRAACTQRNAEPVQVTLTFKGPCAVGVAGGIKAREELEVGVADEALLTAILARVGLRPVVRYEKRREAWRLADCAVMLDELPRLGWFVEIEGPTEAVIRAAQASLALESTSMVPETYVELAAANGDVDESGVCVLRF